MKKMLCAFIVAAMLMTMTAAGVTADAATYAGVGDSAIGGVGSIEVSVSVDGSDITAVEVTKNGDTPGISDAAITGIPQASKA